MSASGLRKLDHLSFTIGDSTSPAVILEQLRFKFTELGYGRHRYRNGAQANAGGLNVFWDGVTEGMGTHVQISGEGCRLVEAQPWFTSWREFIGGWIERGAKFARVDEGWDAAIGVARSFIEFKDESHVTTDRSRQRPAEWWVQLIDASKHVLKISREANASLLRAWQWLKRQAAPVLAVLLEHEGGDISWFLEMAKEGKPKKWTERHRKMLMGEGMLPSRGAA